MDDIMEIAPQFDTDPICDKTGCTALGASQYKDVILPV